VWIDGYHQYQGDHYVWFPATTIVRRIPAHIGCGTTGCTGMEAGFWWKGTGGRLQPEQRKRGLRLAFFFWCGRVCFAS